mmetsp:Transcript_10326/g.34463  ORF Transcript_10326/g.34463 Transcript_10326/m.34463 type:complete len:102 (-) Transcript_10326:1041-1346(-)
MVLRINYSRTILQLVLVLLALSSSHAARRYRRHKTGPSQESLMKAAERRCAQLQCSDLDQYQRQACIFKCISGRCYDVVFGQDEVRRLFSNSVVFHTCQNR